METINALARSQEALGKEIQRQLANFKKDSTSRKTEQYFQDKINALESIWEEIEKNHVEISKQECQSHVYYTDKYFDQLDKIYNEAIAYINAKKEQQLASSSNQATQSPANRLKEEEVRINQLNQVLDRTVDDLQEEKPISRYQLLYNKISKHWETISEIYIELQVQGRSRAIKKPYEDIELKYEKVLETLETKIRGQEISNQTSKSCNISLPQIKLPFFDGQYEEWITFRDIFRKVVHENKNLTQIERMQYLKTHIRGEASRLVQHLQISDINYQTAWQILSDRYSNERLIISKLIDRILDIPAIHQESASKIKQLHDTIIECLEALKNINIDTASWSPIISRIIARKWDSETNKLYEQSLKEPHKVQDFVEVRRFLQARFQSLEAISNSPKIPPAKTNRTTTDARCTYCSQSSHTIYNCTMFQALSPSARLSIVKEKKLCLNCLSHDDNLTCTSTGRCRICKKAHHTHVHVDNHQNKNQPKRPPGDNQSHYRGNRSREYTTNHASRKDEMVLLATALTKVKTAQGDYEYLRVLVDSGSQSSFITEEAACLLALPRQKIRVEISGLGARDSQTAKSQIETTIHPRFPSNFSLDTVFLVLPKLTQTLPGKPLNVDISHWNNDLVADPTFHKPGPIDIILGAKEYAQILLEGVRKTNDGILGQNTELGWIFSGNTGINKDRKLQVLTVTTGIQEDLQLTKFWEIEEILHPRQMTKDEQICEEQYALNTTRGKDGTYTVRIPFNGKEQALGISKQRAAARFIQLETKLSRDETLNSSYKQFMQDYLDLGHMKICDKNETEFSKYYIPHHHVLKESSTTTKLRVVFDASSKTSSGFSLNETMYTGPKLQQELSDILLRWRSHKIVITADIEKMYRQIKIHPDDQKFQRILWRFNKKHPIQEYCLTTVTYGTTSAPYLAIKTLQQLASDEATHFPKAAEVALHDFYVDDLLSGADTLEEALELQDELIKMFRSGGFTLRKWSSNRNQLLQALPDELKDPSSVEITEDETRKSLGIHWAPHDDTFRFKTTITEHTKITKRSILSEVAKLFDPLGWLAPVIIKAKLLIQELWLQELRWDDTVPEHIQTKWKKFQAELKNVEQFTIFRWTRQSQHSNIEIHGFCDASEKAYGAVIYMKITNPQDEIQVTLLTAKSKVAPARIKATLPRLELCAAVLLSKLIKRTILALSIEQVPVYAYSDSMITLSWIKGEPSRWKNFVANRVSEINKLVSSEFWHHVKSEDNPADVISRGLEPSKLKEYSLWWQGPSWLMVHDVTRNPLIIPATTEEEKICYTAIINTQTNGGNEIIQRFSSLTRMIRVISYCKRFLEKCRKKKHPTKLTVEELTTTLLQIVKMEQQCYFQEEIKTLQKKNQLESKSKILNLNPFLDNDQVLRVGGRLRHSQLPFNNKHPMILASRSHLARCVVIDAHLNTLHGGNQLTLSYTRKRFWIINGKNTVKHIVKHCTRCIRFKAQTAEQQMGDLPAPRVTPSHPFFSSGVDYAGPIQIKTSRGRGLKSLKGYIAIFVCLVTKAVHLEVVSDMSSDMFLAAFRRFVARRGPCSHLYSDNGTNFVGASKILKDEIREIIRTSNTQDTLISAGTQWHFIPPSAPHFGGLWEAGVKSMKYHLKRIIGETRLTFEELSTLTHQIEACLNSRPLSPLSNDPEDLSVLTPGHFLIGREIISPPDPVTTNINSNLNERWKLVQKIKRDFWKSWSNNYLHQLQQRYKWKQSQEPLKIGELVLIKEDINPSKWPLAKITEVFPTSDKSVRVVTVRKADGHSMKRPIHKLIPISIIQSPETVQHGNSKFRKPQNNPRSTHLWRIAILAILFMNTLQSAIAQNYTIHYPEPGIFIEHIGHAKIDRGNFRIELKFEKSKISNDTSNVALAIEQMTNLCRDAKELATSSQCTSLIHHLQEKEKQLLWMKKGMEAVVTKREKRGLLGKFLTSIFGVNDEVYMNIDELDKNQRELIKTSKHQTKFMLHALATFNETETRINNNLERFQQKLNEGIKIINGMQGWFRKIDENKLEIHILSTYQIISNYIDELLDYYRKLLEVHYHRANIYELISPAHAEEIIAAASQKLPSTINIISYPTLRTEVRHSNDFIHVYGYFMMTEINDFVLLKPTPIPVKTEKNAYWILELTNGLLAADYNSQLYFELTEEEFHDSLSIGQNIYVCSPTITRTMDGTPHCIIDEVYQRTENTSCRAQRYSLQSVVWKQLYTPNAWMAVTTNKFKIAIICDGIREDATISQTAIIEISSNCVIKTKKNILTPRRSESVTVLGAFVRPVQPSLETFQSAKEITMTPDEEQVIDASDQLSHLQSEEQNIDEQLQNTKWTPVYPHLIISSSIVLLVLGVTAMTLIWLYLLKKKSTRQSHHTPGHALAEEMLTLEPLCSVPLTPRNEKPSHQNDES